MLQIFKPIVDKLHAHASGCKKAIGECYVCNKNMEWFGSLPLQVLSAVLEEPVIPAILKQSLSEIVADKLISDLEGMDLSKIHRKSLVLRLAASRVIENIR